MKYMILSDIHGCETTLKQVLEAFREKNCDYLLLLGDILYYGPRNCIPEGCNAQGVATLLNQINDKVMAIRGNCDAEVDQMLLDFPCMSDYAWVMDEGNRLFLTHGHIYNEEHLPKGKIDFFFYGHTHLWKLEKQGETVICNVGSITFPKGGNLPTYAIYEKGEIRIYSLTDHSLLKKITR